jgi:protein-tyrosine phosphatase
MPFISLRNSISIFSNKIEMLWRVINVIIFQSPIKMSFKTTPQQSYLYTEITPIINKNKRRQREASEVIPGFMWLGDASNAMDVDALVSLDISAVVNCAAMDTLTNQFYYPETWRYTEYEASDDLNYELLERHLDEFVRFIDECRGEKRKVLVHCVGGINRSATLCVAYLVIREGLSLKEAITQCYQARPCILTNEHFLTSLIERFVKL